MADEETYPGWRTFSDIIGWVYFVAWSISFYPQVYTNWKRKAVTGLSFDYEFYNILGFSCLSLYNGFFFWSEEIQRQYSERFNEEAPKVAINDVFFGFHAVALTIIHIAQIAMYDRGRQKVSWFAIFVISGASTAAIIWSILVWRGYSQWLDVLYFLSYIKLGLTFIKYLPQVYLNWKRKSTVGWNIFNILLDFTGGFLSLCQLLIDCWVDNDWSGITGNIVKFGLGFVSMFFDLVFMTQHFILYTDRSEPTAYEDEEIKRLVEPEVNLPSSQPQGFFAWLTSQERPVERTN